MNEFETESDAQPTTQALTTVFRKEHHQIGEDFVKRITSFLKQEKLSIKDYAVSTEKYYDIEAISFSIDDNTKLEIKLTRTK